MNYYKNKYHKYKLKYNNLLNQSGGNEKITKITDKINEYFKSDELQLINNFLSNLEESKFNELFNKLSDKSADEIIYELESYINLYKKTIISTV
jgi:hypothetical protein